MSTTKVTTSVRVDETLFKKIKLVAEKERRSLNAQMETAFEQCVRNFEKEYGEIVFINEDF